MQNTKLTKQTQQPHDLVNKNKMHLTNIQHSLMKNKQNRKELPESYNGKRINVFPP